MWYTFPSDKKEQQHCIDSINDQLHQVDDEDDIQNDLENLADIYSGEKPFDAKSAYDMLYHVYSAMDLTDEKSKEELFGNKDSLEAFQENFLEAWKRLSYIVLTNGSDFTYPEERDKFLKVYDQLHENNKMEENSIQQLAQDFQYLLNDVGDLRDNLTKIEESLGNAHNADDIYLGIEGKKFPKSQYIENRLQLLQQFAQGDVTDIKAYLPFYGSAENIRLKKESSPEEVKKVAANMKDESLMKLREDIRTSWENQKPDPNYQKLSKASVNNDAILFDAINKIDGFKNKEEEYKTKFFDTLQESCDKAKELFPHQILKTATEYDAILKENQDLFEDIQRKIQADPEIAEYEEPMKDMLQGFKTGIDHQAAKAQFSSLYEVAKDEYTKALTQYKKSLNQPLSVLDQKHKEILAEDRKYNQENRKLQEKEDHLIHQRESLDLLSKDQLEQHLKDKKEMDQGFKELHESALPVQAARKVSLTNLTTKAVQKGTEIANDFAATKKTIADSFTPERLEKSYQEIIDNLKAYNERYTTYFRDVEKRYAQVLKDRQSLNEVFEASKDIAKKKGFFSITKKNPKIFTDTMNSMEAYIQDRKNPKKAAAAYDACRNYVASYMKSDHSGLKSGNADGNTRRQAVVRMLELMDKLPEFQKFIDSGKEKKNDWQLVDDKHPAQYTKLNYKQLEASLAKHSSKPKKSAKNAPGPQKNSAFNDIDKLISKRKEPKEPKVKGK